MKADLKKDQAFVLLNSEYQVKNNLNTRNSVIKRVGVPVNDGDAANKKFVTDTVEESTAFSPRDRMYFAKRNIHLNKNKLRG